MRETYDYITVSNSKEHCKVIFAYSEPQNGVRHREYLAEKTYNRFSKTEQLTSGENRTVIIDRSEFFWACGMAFGEISCEIPKD